MRKAASVIIWVNKNATSIVGFLRLYLNGGAIINDALGKQGRGAGGGGGGLVWSRVQRSLKISV